MGRRLVQLGLVVLAALGAVVAWQRRNETPPTPPPARAAEPFMTASAAAPERPHVPGADPAPADDLTRIAGIGPKLQALLNAQGITTFAQLAGLDEAGIDALQAQLPQFPGRIRRDDWVGQAAALQSG